MAIHASILLLTVRRWLIFRPHMYFFKRWETAHFQNQDNIQGSVSGGLVLTTSPFISFFCIIRSLEDQSMPSHVRLHIIHCFPPSFSVFMKASKNSFLRKSKIRAIISSFPGKEFFSLDMSRMPLATLNQSRIKPDHKACRMQCFVRSWPLSDEGWIWAA